MKSFIFSSFFVLFAFTSHAQVGIGTVIPDGALDIVSTNDGLLIPRVALTSTATVLPVITGTTSELVYNTATTGDVTPGFYYLSSATGPWVRLATATASPEIDPKVQSSILNRIPKWNGTGLVDGIVNDDGVRVGIGTGASIPLGALEINSTNDGLVIPRVALLFGATLPQPLAAPTTSELIYNTATVGTSPNNVTPGFYFWTGSRWERFVTGAQTGWSTTGNAGLVATTNFLGTTDAVDVSFRRNNSAAGRIGATSTSFGVSALAANTGANNTAFGTNALSANNTPSDNTAIGFNALAINTQNADTGALNTAVGSGALANLNGGNNNTAVGYNALNRLPTTARFNTALGSNALSGINTNASINNVAIGFNTMVTAGTLTECVAIGSNALVNTANNTTRNTAVGTNAGSNITSGSDNVAIGANAQVPNATGANQVRIGSATIGYAGVQVAWTTTSDKRWKKSIKDSELGLDFLKTLRPVSYIRNNDEKGKTEYGFIAQELEAAFEKVGDSNNGVISKDDAGMLGVRYNDFISISVKAIQEQQLQIESLQKKNEELLKMNEAIMKRLEALEKK